MVRKQLYITQEQDRKLKALSADLEITEAELIRRALGGLNEDTEGTPPELEQALALLEKLTHRFPVREVPGNLRADLYKAHPRNLDHQSWIDELNFIRERARLLPDGGSTEKWSREDSYDEDA